MKENVVVYDVIIDATDVDEEWSAKVTYESLSKRPEVAELQEMRGAVRDLFQRCFKVEAATVEHRVKSRVVKVKTHAS